MNGFPLFRLPLLPLKNVIENMSSSELTMLFLCSEKTGNVIKALKRSVSIDHLLNKEKLKLNAMELISLYQLKIENSTRGSFECFPEDYIAMKIVITDKLKIKIDSTQDYEEKFSGFFPIFFEVMPINHASVSTGTKRGLKIGSIKVPVKLIKLRIVHTFWENPCDGFITLVTYFKKFFNTEIIELCICGNSSPAFSQNLRTAIQGLNRQPINICVIHKDIVKDDDYKLILDNVNPKYCFEQLEYHNSRLDDFRHKTSFKSNFFKLRHANWFTFDNLITMDCKYITLFQSRFTNDDICKYLKLWMAGKYPKLDYLNVELRESVNMKFIFSELKSENSRIYEVYRMARTITIKKEDGAFRTISNSSGNIIEFSMKRY